MRLKPMSLSAKIGGVIVLGFTAGALALAGCNAAHSQVGILPPSPVVNSHLYPHPSARFPPLEGGTMWVEADAD